MGLSGTAHSLVLPFRAFPPDPSYSFFAEIFFDILLASFCCIPIVADIFEVDRESPRILENWPPGRP
jgi:hypothetical protein